MISSNNPRQNHLSRIYQVYDEFAATQTSACLRGCAYCCTPNATLTTLEAFYIATSALATPEVFRRLTVALDSRRFKPRITTNELAEICLKGKEPPSENNEPSGVCPLLEQSECLIYPVRPFHCRCMTSKTDCEKTGTADMDPFVMTVNTVLLQYIEHIDADGCSGNLVDGVLWLQSKKNQQRWLAGESIEQAPGLIPNRRVPALMIPPRHRRRIAGLLEKLRADQKCRR